MGEERKPFWVKCPACSHCWAAAYTPIGAELFAKLTKRATCPMCGETKNIGIAKQDDGRLLENCPPPAPGAIDDAAKRLSSWLTSGDTGISSKAIAAQMTGGKPDRFGWGHPHDPDDLGRCLRLLALFPEWTARIGEMAVHGPAWAGLAARWDELTASMTAEVGIDWSKGKSAPKTYDLMQSAIADGYRASSDWECTFDSKGHMRSAWRKPSKQTGATS